MAPRAVTPANKAAAEKKHEQHYEFSGPYLGPIGIIFGLPALTFAYSQYCDAAGWPNVGISDLTPARITADVADSFSLEAFLVYTVYWLYTAVLYLILPGAVGKGVKRADGSQLMYPFNGLLSLFVVLATTLGIHYLQPFGSRYTLLWIVDNHVQLTMATIIFSTLMSIFLYWYSFQGEKLLAPHGNSGIWLYDFFIGRELDPRVLFGQLDLKYFNELRPGLVMWFLVNIACAYKQMQLSGASTPDAWMLLVLAFEGYYVIDSVLNEPSILTTMDIIMDGFGFMLAFGDLAWVPGMYTLQARFLAPRYSPLITTYDYACFAGVVGLGMLGMYIFRGANSQKDLFKRNPNDPSVKHLKTIPTPTGSKLLADGWWGKARHINYFGDWLMAVAWCLPTGFSTPLTYFYPIYFAVLLIHRDMRDAEKCQAKYKDAWTAYCKAVPYRIVPYVY